VEVDGATVAYTEWGRADRPVLVLIHGGAAHGGWWDHIAPSFADSWHVLAPSLSGHGDSDHLPSYGVERWAIEVGGVVDAATEGFESVALVGHSLGGFVAAETARRLHRHAPRRALLGIVALESPEPVAGLRPGPPGRLTAPSARRFTDPAEALARFDPWPDGPTHDFIVDRVARAGLRRVEGGWAWKHDPRILREPVPTLGERPVPARVVVVRGENGWVTPERLPRGLPPGTQIEVIPEAGHHPMLDQPRALTTALHRILAQWQEEAER